jgi:phosphomannomutase
MKEETLNSIFRAYDIRGKYPSELNKEFYENLGKAYVTLFKPKKVVVGCDMRPESVELKMALVKGVRQMGCDVVDLGEIATEILYFAVGEYCDSFDGGFVITASHNGVGWNGCKIVGKNAKFVSGITGLMDLKRIILEGKYEKVSDKNGSLEKLDVYPPYRDKVLSFITSKNKRPLNIVVDAGNGMGGKLFDYVFDKLDINIERMYFEPDGTYPNHEPNPMEEENVSEIKLKVVASGADFGIAIDGDADRVFFIDKKGRRPDGAYTGVLLARSILEKGGENKRIIHDPRITWPFIGEAEKIGAETTQSVAGRSFLQQAMAEKMAIFGAEASSHFYYRDFYNCDSGMITIANMLNMYYEGFELTKEVDYLYENYPNSGEVNYGVENSPEFVSKIENHYRKDGGRIEKIDGLSVEFENWRFNLRVSNTQPLIRLNLEATDKRTVIEKFLEVERMIGAKRDNVPALDELMNN